MGALALALALGGCASRAPGGDPFARPDRRAEPAPAPEAEPATITTPSAPARTGTLGRAGWGIYFAAEPPFADADELIPYLEGVASWYGPPFHGRQTANGEVYNQFGLTAAHPVLPMGTKIQVENLANGRKVWVRVNDRGPYKKGRILDLSEVAAEQLGMIQLGTAPVRITVLRWPETIQPELGARAFRQFVVQVRAFPGPAEAEVGLREVQARFPLVAFRVDLPPLGPPAVIAGPYDDAGEAERMALRLQQADITCVVRSYRK